MIQPVMNPDPSGRCKTWMCDNYRVGPADCGDRGCKDGLFMEVRDAQVNNTE